MADSVIQTPLGINSLGYLLANSGFQINSTTQQKIGTSKNNSSYIPGTLITSTALNALTFAINDGYVRGILNSNATLSNTTYNALISIGANSIPALGNSMSPGYIFSDPIGDWSAFGYPATTGYSITGSTGQGQNAAWNPYNLTNADPSITQWGYLRLHALQGWNEFNWNGSSVAQLSPQYKEFCGSFSTVDSFINATNASILTATNAQTYMTGTFSNMNDLVTSDITGVSLSTYEFGTDLINSGKVIDLSRIDGFGLPSVLLNTLVKYSAVNDDLPIAMLMSGISPDDLTGILTTTNQLYSSVVEIQLYNSFKLITDDSLNTILSILGCTTRGLTSLADVLDVKKLFPNSYQTLTVPVYNSELGLDTNSKTYYLIYTNQGLNPALTSSAIRDYVGTLVPSGNSPAVSDSTVYSVPVTGFDSYLVGILPAEQANAAGALSFSLQQINNINEVNVQNFAQAVKGIETVSGYNDIGLTSTPTDNTAIQNTISKLALGSGPYGTYTVSDMYGCMSGLSYDWTSLNTYLNQLSTTKLKNIYTELFRSIVWEQATATVQYTTNGDGTHTVTGITVTDSGGGYGRGSAPAPIVTIAGGSGATATAYIGTDYSQIGSNSSGTFSRVTNIVVTSPGTPNTTIPTVTLQAPPIGDLPVNSDGSINVSGTNTATGTAAWPALNSSVQAYIVQANAEIANILNSNLAMSAALNNLWNSFGSQLMIEQRSRFYALSPVSIPKDNTMYPTMTTISNFVNDLSQYAVDTNPHMSAQTLDAIVDLSTSAGQSISAVLKQSRNNSRLSVAGIGLSDNIPNSLSDQEKNALLVNGTLPSAVNNTIGGNTNPSYFSTLLNGVELVPSVTGTYTFDPNSLLGTLIPTSNTVDSTTTSSDELSSVIPTTLNPDYVSTLPNSSLSIADAINQVTTCNCDCQIKT